MLIGEASREALRMIGSLEKLLVALEKSNLVIFYILHALYNQINTLKMINKLIDIKSFDYFVLTLALTTSAMIPSALY